MAKRRAHLVFSLTKQIPYELMRCLVYERAPRLPAVVQSKSHEVGNIGLSEETTSVGETSSERHKEAAKQSPGLTHARNSERRRSTSPKVSSTPVPNSVHTHLLYGDSTRRSPYSKNQQKNSMRPERAELGGKVQQRTGTTVSAQSCTECCEVACF